jgi:hypothetical protein
MLLRLPQLDESPIVKALATDFERVPDMKRMLGGIVGLVILGIIMYFSAA